MLPGLGLPAAQARDDTVYECSGIGADDLRVSDGSDSAPLSLLGVERAQQVLADGRKQRKPVAVAVLDSGVSTASGLITVAESKSFAGHELGPARHRGRRPDRRPPAAGRQAGRGGARGPDRRRPRLRPGPAHHRRRGRRDHPRAGRGPRLGRRNARRLHIEVANVSLAVTGDGALAAAVRRVREAGVLLVAASGNRPTEDTDPLIDRYGPDGSDIGPGRTPPGWCSRPATPRCSR